MPGPRNPRRGRRCTSAAQAGKVAAVAPIAALASCALIPQVAAGPCVPRFVAPPAPLHATDLNGISIPPACFPSSHDGEGGDDKKENHVFVIGDWGGVQVGPGAAPVPADHRAPQFVGHHRPFVHGADDSAQQKVAEQMQIRANATNPDYIINVGDNFYWGGVKTHCGAPTFKHINTGQWHGIFENVYHGPGIDGKQWLGVLGNHDYGGYLFTAGWDQSIGYTWGGPTSTGRWMTPAQYWRTRAIYDDFSVDYYFVDSNVFNAGDPNSDGGHNLCGLQHNTLPDSCGPQGPTSVFDCPGWFGRLWVDQLRWLDLELPKSTADWQIVVTHFPPIYWGEAEWAHLADKHGIDVFITGHTHKQYVTRGNGPMNETLVVISGGGGGITSEGAPDKDGYDDMYGFMDIHLSKGEIVVEAISHGGVLRSRTRHYPRPSAVNRKQHMENVRLRHEAEKAGDSSTTRSGDGGAQDVMI